MSTKAGQLHSRIRELTGRDRRHVPTHTVVGDLNRFLGGWREYYS
ncbi:MAG: group II intron maturase-specific domain-containing protein [Candidatus Dormibacteraceae bacterium]